MSKSKKLNFNKELKKRDFRVAIFGSARIKKNDLTYKHVFELAKLIGQRGYDIVTGGGPGVMEAANSGHAAGDKMRRADSIGLVIHLPNEKRANRYLELREDFTKFSERLDEFMKLSNILVVTKGGLGTLLELAFCWQLLQVGHSEYKPIILIGKMWEKLIEWTRKYPLKKGLMSPKDFDFIHIAKDDEEAMKIIDKFYKFYCDEGKCRRLDDSENM